MRVLFVCRAIPYYGISPIMSRQGESLKNCGIDLEYFPIEGTGFRGYFTGIFKLRKYLSRHKFDILHAHYGLCGLVVVFAKRRERTVLSFMGSELFGKPKSMNIFSLTNFINIFINNLCIRRVNAIVVKSESMTEVLKTKTYKFYIIPNGVDLQKFYRVDKALAREKIQYKEKKKIIIFISDPPGRKEKNLKLVSDSLKILNDNSIELICLSQKTQDILNYYYSATDLLVLSSFHEGSPNVIKEAMACNCPILTTDVGDAKWIIGNTIGCFIGSYDPMDFASKIRLALEFSNNFEKTNGRDRLIELGMDSMTIARKIIEVYENVLKNE